MRVLLDTHALIWWLWDRPELSPRGRRLLGDSHTQLVWSTVATWELAIKVQTGRMNLRVPLERLLEEGAFAKGVEVLPVLQAHALRVAGLPLHHRDPFDRMLVAQALEEGLPLLSRDTALRAYGVEVIW